MVGYSNKIHTHTYTRPESHNLHYISGVFSLWVRCGDRNNNVVCVLQLFTGKDQCRTPDSPESVRAVAPLSPISPHNHHSNNNNSSSLAPPRSNRNGSSSPLINGRSFAANFPFARTKFHNNFLDFPFLHIGSSTPPLASSAASTPHAATPTMLQDPLRALTKVRRFLGALIQFGQDTSADIGDRVRALILSLAVS